MDTHTQCIGITQKHTRCKNKAHTCKHHQIVNGAGIKDFYKKVINFIPDRVKAVSKGVRTTPSAKFQSFLDKEGSQPIQKIEIARKPINSNISKILNLISLGGFNTVKKKLGYEDVFHSYLLITVDGKTYKVEKNHIVQESEATEKDKNNEKYNLTLPSPNMTVKQLIDKSADKDLYYYDPSNRQCQDFTRRLIEENGITTTDPTALEVIKPQDSAKLIDSLGVLSSVPRHITDVASIADRAVTGNGITPYGFRHQSKLFHNLYHR